MKRIVKLTESDLKNIISSILEETSDFDNGGMDDSEFEVRRIIHKIIGYVGPVALLATVPAAMFIGGGVAAALGVTALAGTMFKDAAFFKRGGKYRDHHYDAQDKAEKMNKDSLSENDESPEKDLVQKAQAAVQQLSPEEQQMVASFIQNNPKGFLTTVKKEISQEKQEESPEMSMDEGPGLLGTLKNMYKAAVPEIKVFQKGAGVAITGNKVLDNLMTKVGRVYVGDAVLRLIEPIKKASTIAEYNIVQLQKVKLPRGANKYDDVDRLQRSFNEVSQSINVAKGQPIFFDTMFNELTYLKQELINIHKAKLVSPAGGKILKEIDNSLNFMRQEIANALSAMVSK